MQTTSQSDQQTSDKTVLRKALRQARRDLGETAQNTAADNLLGQLLCLDAFTESRRVAMYLANDGEIAPSAVMSWMHENNRQAFLPMVRQAAGRNSLLFAEAKADTRYVDNHFGIAEPVVDENALVQPDALDLVLLPLVGFDHAGNRIGMGGGFYDTTFAFLHKNPGAKQKPVLIGLAHECQKVAEINAESWDIPLSIVVTDQQIYRLGQ